MKRKDTTTKTETDDGGLSPLEQQRLNRAIQEFQHAALCIVFLITGYGMFWLLYELVLRLAG